MEVYVFITDILKVKSKVFFFNWTNATQDSFGCLFALVCSCERRRESRSCLLLVVVARLCHSVHFHPALTSTTGQTFEKQLTWVSCYMWLWKRKKKQLDVLHKNPYFWLPLKIFRPRFTHGNNWLKPGVDWLHSFTFSALSSVLLSGNWTSHLSLPFLTSCQTSFFVVFMLLF